MSVSTVGSNQAQTIGSLLLQQLAAEQTGSQDTSGDAGLAGDLMTLSPAAKQLSQAPKAVVQAMSDLFSGQTDVSGDLSLLKSYFQQNPQSLSSLLSGLQGGTGTYSASSSADSTTALLTALTSGKASSSDSSALLSLLLGNQSQDPLFATASAEGSNAGALSVLG
jgi:hypothetical protein